MVTAFSPRRSTIHHSAHSPLPNPQQSRSQVPSHPPAAAHPDNNPSRTSGRVVVVVAAVQRCCAVWCGVYRGSGALVTSTTTNHNHNPKCAVVGVRRNHLNSPSRLPYPPPPRPPRSGNHPPIHRSTDPVRNFYLYVDSLVAAILVLVFVPGSVRAEFAKPTYLTYLTYLAQRGRSVTPGLPACLPTYLPTYLT